MASFTTKIIRIYQLQYFTANIQPPVMFQACRKLPISAVLVSSNDNYFRGAYCVKLQDDSSNDIAVKRSESESSCGKCL